MGFIAVYADWVTLHRVLLQFSLFMTPPNFVRGVQARNPSVRILLYMLSHIPTL